MTMSRLSYGTRSIQVSLLRLACAQAQGLAEGKEFIGVLGLDQHGMPGIVLVVQVDPLVTAWRGPGVQGAQDGGAARSALGRVAVRCLEGADAACIGEVCGLAVQGVAVLPIGMDGVASVLQGFE